MLLQNIPLGARASLGLLRTDRFKTAMLAVSLTLPATVERSVANQLLSGVLRRGTVRYPSSALLNRRLDELYAAGVEIKELRKRLLEQKAILTMDQVASAPVNE